MRKPFFSVVIPTFNRAEKLLRCLTSLNRQTYCNFEVLVCDDGSTDDTRKMIEQFRKKINFSELRYFSKSKWGGPARPRNVGIKNARADWICFLDSDDTWYPNKLEKISRYCKDFDLIYHAFDFKITGPRPRRLKPRQLKTPVFHDLMLKGYNDCIINSGVCVRKEIVMSAGLVSEDRLLIAAEDADLWLKISRITNRFKYIPQVLGVYYQEGDNLSNDNQFQFERLEYLFKRHACYLEPDELKELSYKTHCYALGRIKQSMGEPVNALYYFKQSVNSPNFRIKLRSFYWIVNVYLRHGIFAHGHPAYPVHRSEVR